MLLMMLLLMLFLLLSVLLLLLLLSSLSVSSSLLRFLLAAVSKVYVSLAGRSCDKETTLNAVSSPRVRPQEGYARVAARLFYPLLPHAA